VILAQESAASWKRREQQWSSERAILLAQIAECQRQPR